MFNRGKRQCQTKVLVYLSKQQQDVNYSKFRILFRSKKMLLKVHDRQCSFSYCCVSVISYLVGAGGSSTVCEGADPEATTAAVATVTGKGLAG